MMPSAAHRTELTNTMAPVRTRHDRIFRKRVIGCSFLRFPSIQMFPRQCQSNPLYHICRAPSTDRLRIPILVKRPLLIPQQSTQILPPTPHSLPFTPYWITLKASDCEISKSFCTLALLCCYRAELAITEPLIDVCLEAVTGRLRYGRVAPCATLSIATAESGIN